MKVNEPKQTTLIDHPGADTSDHRPVPAAPFTVGDRVTTDDAAHLKVAVASAVDMAASERSQRLQSLTQQVRSGAYSPNVSQLADEILAQAELDARLAATLHA